MAKGTILEDRVINITKEHLACPKRIKWRIPGRRAFARAANNGLSVRNLRYTMLACAKSGAGKTSERHQVSTLPSSALAQADQSQTGKRRAAAFLLEVRAYVRHP